MLKIKFTSSLEKVFKDESFESVSEIFCLSALKNERISFQVAAEIVDTEMFSEQYTVELSGELAKYGSVREVISVPVTLATLWHFHSLISQILRLRIPEKRIPYLMLSAQLLIGYTLSLGMVKRL